MTKYIFRSEKGKNTCDRCKSYDGKIYYDLKDAPTLPLHPNCRCYLEAVEDKITSFNSCNCIQRAEESIQKLNDQKREFDNIDKKFNIIRLDFEICLENAEKLKDIFSNGETIAHKEIGKHELECPNNMDKAFKTISSKIVYTKELLKNCQTKRDKMYKTKENMSDLLKSMKALWVDIGFLKETSMLKFNHDIKECGAIDLMKKYEKDTEALISRFKEISNEVFEYEKYVNDIQKEMTNGYEAYKKILEKKASKCNCKEELKDEIKKDIVESVYDNVSNYRIVGLVVPIAKANLRNGIDDFEPAKKDEHAYVLNNKDELYDKNLKQLLNEVKVPKDSKGVVYDTGSSKSKKLFRAKEIQNFIKEHKEELKNNNINKTANIEFKKEWKFDDEYFGIQNCKLYNPKITKDGFFEAAIVDYFDFAYRNGEGFGTSVNNFGYTMQEKGLLENYFNIYYIRGKVKD